MRPAMAMIVDIRRGNLHVQLMYKGLFELARDRAEFVSMLFAKPRPPVVSARSSAAELFDAFGAVPADEALAARTLAAIERRLTNVHGLRLPAEDLEGIRRVYRAFFSRGFAVRQQPTYADLMTQTDGTGAERSYLASEAAFAFLKDLEARNMIVPLVGDFAGPKALRAVGAFLKARRATVTAFYLSNVEQYLNQDGKWAAFCRNVAALPLTSASTFIRSSSNRGAGFGAGFVTSLGDMTTETKSCGAF
jgi:hypothetical protein